MLLLLLQACSKSDDLYFTEIIVGSWTLDHYEVAGADAEQDVKVLLDRLVITADGHFTLYYPEGDSEGGDYEAGDDYLRLDYTDQAGNLLHILLEVLSVDDNAVSLRYKDPDYDVSVTIYLHRQ